MENRSLDRMLAILTKLAALTVGCMVVAILYTRGSQDFFQTARPIEAFVFAFILSAVLFATPSSTSARTAR